METVNLSLNKNVLVSGSYSDSAGTANSTAITDGSISTGGYSSQGWWSPTNSSSDSAFATVDLASVQHINLIRIYMTDTSKASIAISSDNSAYNTILNGVSIVSGWNEFTLPEKVSARYVKIFGFDSDYYGYNIVKIYEMEICIIKETANSLLKTNNKIYSYESVDKVYNLAMTSEILPAPYKVSSSSSYNTGYANYKAFDGLPLTTTWMSSGRTNQWVQIDFSKPTKTNRVELYSGYYNAACAPKNFQILGSLDGINYTEILKVESSTAWVKGTPKTFEYPVCNYRYYRIYVNTNNGGANYIEINEIKYGLNYSVLTEIPKESKENFVKYGAENMENINKVLNEKNYVLQGVVGDLWKQTLNRKPLSIQF